MVEIKLFANLRETTGTNQIKIQTNQKTNLKTIINQLTQKHPELKKQIYNGNQIKQDINILINEQNIQNEKLKNQEINQKDTIAILPPVSGG